MSNPNQHATEGKPYALEEAVKALGSYVEEQSRIQEELRTALAQKEAHITKLEQELAEAQQEVTRQQVLVESAVIIGTATEQERTRLGTELSRAKKAVTDLSNAVQALLEIN